MKIKVFFKTNHEIFGMDRQQANYLKFKIDGVVWRCPCCWCMFRPRFTSKKWWFFEVNDMSENNKNIWFDWFCPGLFFSTTKSSQLRKHDQFQRDCFFVVSPFFWERVVKGGVAKRVILGFFEEQSSKQDHTPYKSQEHHRESCHCRQCLSF